MAILKHNNYSVDAVYNGEDALAYLQADNYDGAVLDIMMPKMDGITVLKKIRAEGNKVPVLILTAKSDVDDRVLGLDSGADDYLGKPFSAKELLAAPVHPRQVKSSYFPLFLPVIFSAIFWCKVFLITEFRQALPVFPPVNQTTVSPPMNRKDLHCPSKTLQLQYNFLYPPRKPFRRCLLQ